MNLIFLHPEALYLLILILLWFVYSVVSTRHIPSQIRFATISLRFACLVLLLLAIASPALKTEQKGASPHLLIGIDPSASIQRSLLESSLHTYQNYFQKFPLPIKASWFYLTENPTLNALNTTHLPSNDLPFPTLASPLIKSVNQASQLLPPDEYPVFLLLTDGNETELAANEMSSWIWMPIHVIPQLSKKLDPLRIEAVTLPEQIPKGSKAKLELIVYSETEQSPDFFLKKSNGDILEQKPLALDAGYNYFSFPITTEELGQRTYAVQFESETEDANLSNNSTSATCTVYEKNSILFLDKKHRGGLFVKLLKDMGFTVQIAEPKALPQDLQVFSCVLLHDLPASDIPEWFQQKIRDYVFQGGGFGFLGGPDSFGAGGYFKSTIEEISPVFMPPRSYKQSLAIVLLIDSSGSMLANDSKITSSQDLLNLFLKNKNNLKNSPILAAQKAAIAVLEDLVAVDVAVVSFNEKARLAVPLQTVHEDNLEDIRSQIYTISAGGGTRFYPALTGAESLIKDQGYKEVHFLLLSDGQPEDKDFVDSAIELLKGDQITLSTIAFGQEAARGLLRKMAEQTGGQFFASHHVATLRSTFKKAVEKVFGPPVILESRNTKFSEGQSIVREKKATPKVLGLMSTAPKKRSQNIIITESGEPLLSIGNFGSGKCFVWTSDITGKWSHFWLTSPSMKSIMGTVLAAVSNNSSKPFTIRTEQKGNVLTVMLTALNEQGEFIDDLSVSSYLHNTETDESYSIPILYEGSGEYRGEISLSDKSATELNIDVNLGTQNWSEKFKLSPPSNPEFSSSKANSALFEQLEQQRENSIISSPEQIQSILNTYQPKIYTEQESLVIPLYAFLIFLLFLDVLFRRFRVYEALEEQNRKQSTPEKRWEKLADYHWKKARALLKEGELKNAENSFLSAHKYYIDAKKQDKAADVWQEYTIKIK